MSKGIQSGRLDDAGKTLADTVTVSEYMEASKKKNKTKKKEERKMATKKATKKNTVEKSAVQKTAVQKPAAQKYIVRCDRAGVFYGEIARHMGPYVVLRNVRKIWYWDGACAVEELAVNGTVDPKSCRLTVKVDEMAVSGVVQMIPCTKKAADALDGIKEWKRAKED